MGDIDLDDHERIVLKPDEVIPVQRLSRDLKEAALHLSEREARYLVDAYYQMQADRIRGDHQVRQMEGEPTLLLSWLASQSEVLEKEIKKALDRYTRAQPIGVWMRTHKGVGPVIAAGFLAHLDIHRAPTVGHFHSFCGIHPGTIWEKGKKRPFNMSMKRLCFLLGESFIKCKGGQNPSPYGLLYDARKKVELARNEAGELAAQAEDKLARTKVGKGTEAYKWYSAGKLPPGHIHARCRRYVAKAFLSDLHTVWHWMEYERLPPLPYIIAHPEESQQHSHLRWPIGHELVPGLSEALKSWQSQGM